MDSLGGEGCAARRARGGLLGGRGLCFYAGERWAAWWQRAVLLGDRGEVLGGRDVLLGGIEVGC